MKKFSFLLILFVCSIQISLSQKVDSIKVEQTGDFIKIKYKIADSKAGQVFRVKVLCSINGGLNTEIESVSGDTGDQVAGGKPEYWVVWDVLKDVENLNSAEFIVRAELVSDLSSVSSSIKGGPNTTGWDKKLFNVMIGVLAPGPKGGLRIGVMGSFGISGQIMFGKTVLNNNREVPISIMGYSSTDYEPSDQLSLSLNLSKRIVNIQGFQMHVLLGIQRTRIIFKDPNASQNFFQEQKVFGPEIGMAFGVKRLAFSIMANHYNPGQVEKEGDFENASPLNYLSTSIGVRF